MTTQRKPPYSVGRPASSRPVSPDPIRQLIEIVSELPESAAQRRSIGQLEGIAAARDEVHNRWGASPGAESSSELEGRTERHGNAQATGKGTGE